MAATACAYGYQGARQPSDTDIFAGAATKPPPPLWPPTGGNSSKAPPTTLLPLHGHLDLCTEGLGSESSGDCDLSSDDLAADDGGDGVDAAAGQQQQQAPPRKRQHRDGDGEKAPPRGARCGRIVRDPFPPPISVIGASGKPWLYLRPHRADGRLVLREVRIPSRELLQARREDGRFKLHFAQPQPQPQPEEEEPGGDLGHHHHQCQGQQEQQGNE